MIVSLEEDDDHKMQGGGGTREQHNTSGPEPSVDLQYKRLSTSYSSLNV